MEDASLEDFLDGDAGEDDDSDKEETRSSPPASEEPSAATAREVDDCEETQATDVGEAGEVEESPANEGKVPEGAETEALADEVAVAGTYEFTPSGAPCTACGALVERRWRDDGNLLCPACKSW